MAELLQPVASATIDYEYSSVRSPPKTTFPQPDGGDGKDAASRAHSDITSPRGSAAADAARPEPAAMREENGSVAERPSLAARKYDTEMAHPVQPRVQPTRAMTHPLVPDDASTPSDSDAWSSSDEGHVPRLQRSQTLPDRKPLSKAALNRVRTHQPRKVRVGNAFFQSQGRVAKDGRLNISVSETANSGYLAKALGATIERQLGTRHVQEIQAAEKAKADFLEAKPTLQVPRMNIVVMVIGSRGDIQPFLKIGKILRDKYHHRVRIATHPAFKKFVEEEIGLEFFSIGGDPSELMAFMVKNPGLIPSLEAVKTGEIGRRRESMYQMLQGFWRACVNATDDETDPANVKLMGSKVPFVADAIIANPPSFAHYHCAERLSVPLHLVFTFPYSPTQAFPHPLANVKASNVDQSYTNFMSYPLVDLITWQGLGDLINRFRVQTLGLEPVSTLWAPGQISRLRVPLTYLWSPGLVPKPRDWGPEIDIAGYVFLDLASSYTPPADLARFVDRGADDRPVIYIGFGSISGIDDPRAFTKMIFEAVSKAHVRAVVSRGWGGMGDGMDKPDGVFMVDNVPHDWLFPQMDAVVHHGGAGTTAAGLRFGKPTMIVPFFGDQPFWSAMVAKAGAGAQEALPLKMLDADKFARGIRECLEPEAKAKAAQIARSIAAEGDGAENAVDSFHRALHFDGPHSMRCNIFPDRVAVWKVKRSSTRLSALAADLLVENKELHWTDLDLNETRVWTDFQGPGEPLTGAGGVMVQAFQEAYHGIANIPDTAKKDIEHNDRRRRKSKDKSATEALLLPGRIAYATHHASIETQKKEQARLHRELNLRGEAEPHKNPFGPSRQHRDGPASAARPADLTRTPTEASARKPTAVVVLKDVGKGVGHSYHAIAELPLRVWHALALGFHNAPRLYGDKTVRPSPQRITGFRSGLKVAGTEFWLGWYDGVTGVVRIPYLEVRDDGVSGLPKGMARGVGGLVLKPIAGILGLGAFTFKGIQCSIRRQIRDTEKTERWIRRARITQGQHDAQMLQKDHSAADAPPSTRTKELEEIRQTALRQWSTNDRDKVSQAREKEQRFSLLKPHDGDHTPARATTAP